MKNYNSNYHMKTQFWQPSDEVIAALERGDKALKDFYKSVNREHEESTRIGFVVDWEAKVRSFESVLK